MSLERNIKIKNYISALFGQEDEILAKVRENSRAKRLPKIEVPANVGKMLYCLAKIRAPKRVLEIGTLGGYSTIWLARALPTGGKITTLDIDSHNVRVAQEHLKLAGVQDKVEIRLGKASDLLDAMIQAGEKPFDLIFLDANKDGYPHYLAQIMQLASPGTLILSDNLIPKADDVGELTEEEAQEVRGIYKYNELLSEHPQLETILMTTIVGEKGRIDALGVSIVK